MLGSGPNPPGTSWAPMYGIKITLASSSVQAYGLPSVQRGPPGRETGGREGRGRGGGGGGGGGGWM